MEENLPNQEKQNLASQGDALQAEQMQKNENQTVGNEKSPKESRHIIRAFLLGFLFVVILTAIGGTYLLGTYKSNQNSEAAISPSPIVSNTQTTNDETADWQTYTFKNYKFNYPSDWEVIFDSEVANQQNGFSLHIKNINSTELQPDGLFIDTSGLGHNYKLRSSRKFIINKNGDDSLMFEINETKIYSSCAFYKNVEPTIDICNKILSTFKFIDSTSQTLSPNPTKVSPNSVSANGVSLENIKYTLPSGWTPKLQSDSLTLSPSSGGFLSIKAYNYDGVTGGREFYCKTTSYCIDSSTFTPTKIGNISGYRASSLDNSGGGSEYFGSKGNKFYIISTYNPLSPSDFEKGYQSVLNSLQF